MAFNPKDFIKKPLSSKKPESDLGFPNESDSKTSTHNKPNPPNQDQPTQTQSDLSKSKSSEPKADSTTKPSEITAEDPKKPVPDKTEASPKPTEPKPSNISPTKPLPTQKKSPPVTPPPNSTALDENVSVREIKFNNHSLHLFRHQDTVYFVIKDILPLIGVSAKSKNVQDMIEQPELVDTLSTKLFTYIPPSDDKPHTDECTDKAGITAIVKASKKVFPGSFLRWVNTISEIL